MFVRFPVARLFNRSLRVVIGELKKGEWIKYNNKLHHIVVASSVQSGRNCRIYSLQLKPIDSDSIFTIRPNSTETFELSTVHDSHYRFQYEDEGNLYLVKDGTFEEISVPRRLANNSLFDTLEPGQALKIRFEQNGAPAFVEGPRVTECTVAKVDLLEEKKGIATLQSGIQVAVPGFIKVGDRVAVDTTNRSYVTRIEQ